MAKGLEWIECSEEGAKELHEIMKEAISPKRGDDEKLYCPLCDSVLVPKPSPIPGVGSLIGGPYQCSSCHYTVCQASADATPYKR